MGVGVGVRCRPRGVVVVVVVAHSRAPWLRHCANCRQCVSVSRVASCSLLRRYVAENPGAMEESMIKASTDGPVSLADCTALVKRKLLTKVVTTSFDLMKGSRFTLDVKKHITGELRLPGEKEKKKNTTSLLALCVCRQIRPARVR